ncbi:hypothetical protein SNE40_010102 [Patella caerulea]
MALIIVLLEFLATVQFTMMTTDGIRSSTKNIKNIYYGNHQDNMDSFETSMIDEFYTKEQYSCKNKYYLTHVPNCSLLISADQKEQHFARSFTKMCERNGASAEDYITMASDCATFLRNRKYIMDATDEEFKFPVAFSILMYKDVNQVERLLRAIYRPHNYYCIHVDSSADPSVRKAMINIINCLPNVYEATKSTRVVWGKFSVLEPELVCMKDLLRYGDWKYFINLTGQEFPLKTNLQIVKILKSVDGANSVDGIIERKWRSRWKMAGKPPHGIKPVKGNVHVVINRQFVDFAVNDNRSIDFIEWLNKTKIPDESFFNSLNHNPHLGIPGSFKGTNITTSWETKPYFARYKNWGKQCTNPYFNFPCSGKRKRNICIFGIGDLPRLTSRMELFANKFYWDYQSLTLDCIEEWHRKMIENEYNSTNGGQFNTSYYETMPYLKEVVKN